MSRREKKLVCIPIQVCAFRHIPSMPNKCRRLSLFQFKSAGSSIADRDMNISSRRKYQTLPGLSEPTSEPGTCARKSRRMLRSRRFVWIDGRAYVRNSQLRIHWHALAFHALEWPILRCEPVGNLLLEGYHALVGPERHDNHRCDCRRIVWIVAQGLPMHVEQPIKLRLRLFEFKAK